MGQVSKSMTAKRPQPKLQKKPKFRIKRDDVVVVISGRHKGAKRRAACVSRTWR